MDTRELEKKIELEKPSLGKFLPLVLLLVFFGFVGSLLSNPSDSNKSEIFTLTGISSVDSDENKNVIYADDETPEESGNFELAVDIPRSIEEGQYFNVKIEESLPVGFGFEDDWRNRVVFGGDDIEWYDTRLRFTETSVVLKVNNRVVERGYSFGGSNTTHGFTLNLQADRVYDIDDKKIPINPGSKITLEFDAVYESYEEHPDSLVFDVSSEFRSSSKKTNEKKSYGVFVES